MFQQPNRCFSRKIFGMSKEFGQGAIGDEEFLPDKEEAEIKHSIKVGASISLDLRADDILKHNEDVAGTIYKYDLPVANAPIVFKSKQALMLVDEVETLTAN